MAFGLGVVSRHPRLRTSCSRSGRSATRASPSSSSGPPPGGSRSSSPASSSSSAWRASCARSRPALARVATAPLPHSEVGSLTTSWSPQAVRLPDGRIIPEVIVGPHGLTVVEELPPRHASREASHHWEVRDRTGRWSAVEHPLDRAARDVERLRRWLGNSMEDYTPRFTAVCIADDDRVARSSEVAVIRRNQLADFLGAQPVAPPDDAGPSRPDRRAPPGRGRGLRVSPRSVAASSRRSASSGRPRPACCSGRSRPAAGRPTRPGRAVR